MTPTRPASATALALVATLTFSAGAQASTAECLQSRPGVSISYGVTVGVGNGVSLERTEADKNESNLRRLQGMGVEATSAEMWGGCIRAFVRKPGGGEEMQFFHPESFERVEP